MNERDRLYLNVTSSVCFRERESERERERERESEREREREREGELFEELFFAH